MRNRNGICGAFRKHQIGVTLVEVVVFIIVIAVALAATLGVFTQNIVRANDPLIQTRALELAQAQMDEILARKFADNTPSGGVPACGSIGVSPCTMITPDSGFDDVGDFDGFSDVSHQGYTVRVTVVEAGADLGLADGAARRVTVTVSTPRTSSNSSDAGSAISLSAYKVNF